MKAIFGIILIIVSVSVGRVQSQAPAQSPSVAGKCDKCGGELYQRDDDKPETVRSRLEKQRPPADMIEHYRNSGHLKVIDGTQDVSKVTEDLINAIDAKGK